ncbi:aminoglycoside phosphotransferase [Bradyrhizobium sp. SSBR45G]|uniref:phosphotransferase n=1 Tax=unclassified Bradyrhizobium TaxID=2631580 RepID=UPI002342A4CC|nr:MULTISPECIES: phosphotransferase [unclassified Bradyrhizobium]GLH82328.1 aminoglycoside phosphotransferase [Bradyrhizobium sp. SSBR45G]GLH89771.1 aminoglycoside phosphotransferase [Bradyrhizobium sp. SSBR45R]
MSTTTQTALPDAASPERLTEVLRKSPGLAHIRVADVVVESAQTTVLSEIMRLGLAYDGDAPGAPRSLVLKTGRADRRGNAHWDAGRQEVAFYDQVAAAKPCPQLLRCFDAAWDAETRAWHILLEDLSATHLVATAWPLPPNPEQCAQMLRARARLHAAWWDDPRLGASVGVLQDDSAIDAGLQQFDRSFAGFVDRFGHLLPAERRRLVERLIANGRRLHTHHRSHRNMTIVHGDSHVWNIFLPRDGGDDVRIFDWDCWRVDVAADDLAYMMALHWYPDRRQQMERALLDDYHVALTESGVTGYDRAALAEDYRLAVLWQATTPIGQAMSNIPPLIWWNNLERIFLAVDDLGCRDLLD